MVVASEKRFSLNVFLVLQTLSEVEESLREFEQRVTELKTRAEGLQADQVSNQELLKLQVILSSTCSLFPHLYSGPSLFIVSVSLSLYLSLKQCFSVRF